MKRLISLLLLICLLPFAALAEEEPQVVYNRTKNRTEEFVFPEGTPVLEIVFPRVSPRTAPSSALATKP